MYDDVRVLYKIAYGTLFLICFTMIVGVLFG